MPRLAISNDELVSRSKVRKTWIDSAKWIAEKSGDAEAKKLLKLLENSSIAKPVNGGAKILTNGGAISFTIVMTQDKNADQYWHDFYESKNLGAGFEAGMRTIMLRDSNQFDRIMRGAQLLHEAYHAQRYLAHPNPNQDTYQYCGEERDAFELQYRLMSKVGGKVYAKALAEEQKRIIKLLAGRDAGSVIILRDRYDVALDKAFGKSSSDDERNYRQSALWMDAYFTILDGGNDRELKKLNLVCTVYERNGLIHK
jgi:hypothetical protein